MIESDEESEKVLKSIYENTSELFKTNINYDHYVFLPDGNGARNKILKHTIPVRVMISNN